MDRILDELDTEVDKQKELAQPMSIPKTVRFNEDSSILKAPSARKGKPKGLSQAYSRPRSNLYHKKWNISHYDV